jgi:hypothetical protein
MRACLHAAAVTKQTCIKTPDRLAANPPIDHDDPRAPRSVAQVAGGRKLAGTIVAALAVIGGIVALDFLVLWIAAGRLIESLPF